MSLVGSNEWIAESDAERVANISTATLKRFIEAGYLNVESAQDGSRLFSKRQLEELFGFKTDLNSQIQKQEITVQEVPAPTSESKSEFQSVADRSSESSTPESVASNSAQHSDAVPNYNSEVSRLQKTIEMLDRIIEMKDQNIKDLKSQIDWFKGQIDRLEERSQRDQVLMLTENETIRNLAAVMNRKSILRQIVDWIGLDSAPVKPAAMQHRLNNKQAESTSGHQNDT